jgi:subtilisin family serine protease
MGNEGSTNPSYPAAIAGVMPVGATSSEDTLPNFTNCGKHISVTAPGVEILSTVPGASYDELSGTSMATPHVAGLAALLKAAHPTWTAKQLRARIEATADDKGIAGYDIYFGHGRIHAGKALAAN